MRKTVLLTGFEPFNGESVNPAWEAVSALAGWTEEGGAQDGATDRAANGAADGFLVVVRRLPCVFGAANEALAAALAQLAPDLVIAVGQAGGRADLSVERIAINVDDAPIADNAGCRPLDTAVVHGAPAAYFSTLPIKAIARAWRAAGLPAQVSQTAGTFVCNHVFYSLMHTAAGRAMRAGFIHLPYLPEQAAAHPGAVGMALADMVEGLKIAVRTALAAPRDIAEAGGAAH